MAYSAFSQASRSASWQRREQKGPKAHVIPSNTLNFFWQEGHFLDDSLIDLKDLYLGVSSRLILGAFAPQAHITKSNFSDIKNW